LFVTDVSYYNAQAASYLLSGVDPYGASYSVPPALSTPGAGNVFAYLPGVFVFLVPGGADARVGLVACDVVAAVSLLLFRPGRGGQLGALFLLFPPAVLFSTSFLNDSLPAIAFLAVAALFEARRRHLPAAAALGLALASSQEAWFVFPVYFAYSLRNGRSAPPLASLAVGAAAVAPFVLWNPSSFVSDTLLFQFQRGVTPLFSTGPFGLNVNPSLQGVLAWLGIPAPLAARAFLAGVFLLLVVWRSKGTKEHLLLGSAASAAFCLFAVAGDFYWSYLELPFVLVLFWAALRWERSSGASRLKGTPEGVGGSSR
ncbi:MAG: hypothetical protein JRN08_07560, partial [Nitrososphaerota archaeon]|nr:hypothetical protein [Nitrososphaerota archaeon]